jgi:hypothetical protein
MYNSPSLPQAIECVHPAYTSTIWRFLFLFDGSPSQTWCGFNTLPSFTYFSGLVGSNPS